jgi:autotransporter strand-loop-strand O-heptosyltransferase
MKIVQITPGLISIPPNGWGAIEKMIWEYKLSYESLGHTCDIKFLNDIQKGEYDIVHVHVANLALELHTKGIPYYFTMHDHHTVYFGKGTFVYEQNKEAIEKSIKSFVPAKYLLDFFPSSKLYYIPHGVNPNVFTPQLNIGEHKLLCVGNNGMINDSSIDRKGFIPAIESARELNLPITIVGPENNKKFFAENKDYKPYDNLQLIFNPTEEELVKIYREHTIFLHPSNLEAGVPNLTLMEALSCGLPIVSVYEDDPLPGMIKISKERTVEEICTGIRQIFVNYKFLKYSGIHYCKNNTWMNIVSKILDIVSQDSLEKKQSEFLDGQWNKVNTDLKSTMQSQLLKEYSTTPIKYIEPKHNLNDCNINFIDGPMVEIKGPFSENYEIKFIDKGQIIHHQNINNNMWVKCSKKYFIDWKIEINGNEQNTYKFNLDNRRVYIALDSNSLGDNIAWIPVVEAFRKKHNCTVICSTFFNHLFNESYPEIEFVSPGLVIPNLYAMYKIGCFTDSDHTPKDFRECGLQEICSTILGMENIEYTTKLNVKNPVNPLNKKYVCISTASTAGCKHWQNKGGWQKVVDYLRSLDYEVVVIQKEELTYMDLQGLKNVIHPSTNSIQEAMTWISNCEFYIGLSSGMSWIAWALNKKVILISGFTDVFNEFSTPYRIINKDVCNSCWHDKNFRFDAGDWNWCPIFKNTPNQFICTKSITANKVIDSINQIIN